MANPMRSKAIDKQIAILKAGAGKKVEAGWFESDRYGQTKADPIGQPVANVARIQEFGATIQRTTAKGTAVTTVIPARPFMRLAWKQFSGDRKKIQYAVAKKIIDKKLTADQALGYIGEVLEGYIVGSIKNGGWQKNADSTVAKKGFDKPLIDDGHMWKTVNSKVS